MTTGWIIVAISLVIATLACSLTTICTSSPVREGLDGDQGTTTAPPPTGTPQQNATAIKALRDQISGISNFAQKIAVLQRKVQGNEVALVGKDGKGGMQKLINDCQSKCDSKS